MSTPEFLPSRRPQLVQDLNRAAFEMASNGIYHWDKDRTTEYDLNGEDWSYVWQDIYTSSPQVLKKGRRVLDIGCAHANVIRRHKWLHPFTEVVGLTAKDYSRGKDPWIVVGDAHDLVQTLEANAQAGRFDRIMTHMTFCHLNDPLATLEAAANLTAQNGLLVFDDCQIPYIRKHDVIGETLRYLIGNHFELIGDDTYRVEDRLRHGESFPGLPSLMFRRTSSEDQPIIFPIDYALTDVNPHLTKDGWGYMVA